MIANISSHIIIFVHKYIASGIKSGLRRVQNSCVLVLCLCTVMVASQLAVDLVDTSQVHVH